MFEGNKFVPVPGGKKYMGQAIFSILPYNEEKIIVATRDRGLELHNIISGEVLPFENEVNEQIKINKIYHGTISKRNEYVLATLKNGIFVIDKKGKLILHLNEDNGLQNNNVKYVFRDKYDGIWAGTAVGISYIDLNLPLTYFNGENGIAGYSRDVARHDDILYVATGNGVYYLDKDETWYKNKFKQVGNIDSQFWDFLNVGNHLLVGSSSGLYEIKDNKLIRYRDYGAGVVFSLLRSDVDTNRIFLALKNGIAIAEIDDNDEIKIVHRYEKYNTESHQLGEDKNGNLWITTAFDYLVKIENSSFDKEKGYPISYSKVEYGEKLSDEEIIKIDGKLYFTAKDGLLSIDEKGELAPDNSFEIKNLPEGYVIRRMQQGNNGNLWIHYHFNKTSGQLLALKTENNTYTLKDDPFTRINEKISHSSNPFIENDGVVWFGGGEGIVRYDYAKDVGERRNYNVNIRMVALHSDSIVSLMSNKKLIVESCDTIKKNK